MSQITSRMLAAAFGAALLSLSVSPVSASEADGNVFSGDFDGDGTLDLALVVSGQTEARIELLLETGSDAPEHIQTSGPAWLELDGLVPLVGDFDGDARHDIAFQRPGHLWTTLPILFSRPGGTWELSLSPVEEWVHDADTRVAVGDTDRDGLDELALWRPGDQGRSAVLELERGQALVAQDISVANNPGPIALLLPSWDER